MMSDKPSTKSGGRPSIYIAIGLVVLAALLAGGAYAWIGHSILTRPAAPLEDVVIADIVYTGSCPVIVAQAKGYFSSEGIQATTQVYSSGKGALDAVSSGKADLGISGDLPLMFSVMNQQPLSVVATIAKADNDLGIVGRKDKGITTPTSLQGKHIGVSVGTGGHFLLDAFLTRQKLSVRDVTIRDLKAEELPGALAKGEIDAASTWEPVLGTLQTQLGKNGVTFLAGDIYSAALNVVGTQTYVASHTKTLQKVLRALIRGAALCEDYPNPARELVAASFKVDAAGLAASWPDYRFRVTLDQSLLLELEDETRWAIKNKLTNGTDMPNYLNHLDMGALQAVAPAAVTVIH
jgi:NitT/TauT family transport system substrate-binding protein